MDAAMGTPVLLVHVTQISEAVTLDSLAEVFSQVGRVAKAVVFSKSRGVCHGLVQMESAAVAAEALRRFDGQTMYPSSNFMRIQFSALPEISIKQNNARARDFRSWAISDSPLRGATPGCVVIAYNVDPEISCEGLFSLFSFYGVVTCVKFLFSRQDAALVQFAEPLFASLALQHLDEARLHGRALHLEIASMSEIIPSQSASPGRCRSFALKERRPGTEIATRVGRSACRPTAVLHVANLGRATTEESLAEAIPEATRVRVWGSMALVALENPEIATDVLVARHNQPFNGRAMKLSFTKSVFL